MKNLAFAGLAAVLLAGASVTPAAAQGGCGPYAHRGWDGFCHPGGLARPYGVGFGYGWQRPIGYGYHGYGWRGPG